MDANIITKTAHASLSGAMSFPEVVGTLIDAGVEYYYVDYVRLQTSYYSGEGSVVSVALNFENLPSIANDFNATELLANIRDSQLNNQPYRQFSERAMQAGVQGYFAFLRGKRVTYIGRQGDQHTEWFPGSKQD